MADPNQNPSPLLLGNEFVRQYYTMLNALPTKLYKYYTNQSTIRRDMGMPISGYTAIKSYFESVETVDVRTKVHQVNAQASVNNSIIVLVNGERSDDGRPMRPFIQTFVLAKQNEKQYFIYNDIFRFKDFSKPPIYVFDNTNSFFKGKDLDVLVEKGQLVAQNADEQQVESEEPQENVVVYQESLEKVQPEPVAHLVQPPPAPVLITPIAQQTPYVTPRNTGMFPGLPANFSHPYTQMFYTNTTPGIVPNVPLSTTNITVNNYESELMQSNAEISNIRLGEVSGYAEPPNGVPQTVGNNIARVDSEPIETHIYCSNQSDANMRVMNDSSAEMAQCDDSEVPGPKAVVYDNPYSRKAKAAKMEQTKPVRLNEDKDQIFLGAIPTCATKEELMLIFGKFGQISELKILKNPWVDQVANKNQFNYGFLTFEHSNSARVCLASRPIYYPGNGPGAHKLNVEAKKRRLRSETNQQSCANSPGPGKAGEAGDATYSAVASKANNNTQVEASNVHDDVATKSRSNKKNKESAAGTTGSTQANKKATDGGKKHSNRR